MKIYFAHPMSHYDRPYEEECLNQIRMCFPKAEIVNPNSAYHSEKYQNYRQYGMKYFRELVADCDAVVFSTYRSDGEIGMGVFTEVMAMVEENGFIFQVDDNGVRVISAEQIYNMKPLSIAQTRERNKNKVI